MIDLVLLYCSQTEAAAIAVIAANVRKNIEEKKGWVAELVEPQPVAEENLVHDFLQELESAAIYAIENNDGNVVLHLGTAAKQMNPLLS